MKKVLVGFGVVLILVIGAGIFLYSNAGDFIKAAVEKYGSEATQASVTLDGVDLDVTSGSAGLNGFVVGNPEGFQTPSAFELGSVAVQIDRDTIDQPTIVINSVNISGPVVTYELAGGSSNIDAIKANVDEYAQQFSSGEASSSSESASGEEVKLVIERLTITGGRVNVSAGFLDGKALGTDLPDITLTDIGKDSGGATPAEVINQLIDSMTSGVGTAIGGLNLDGMAREAEAQARRALEQATDGAAGAVESVTEGAGAAGEAASGAVQDAGDAIKGILGN